METPEYLICVECETPCYVFGFKEGEVVDVICSVCGNEEEEQFLTEAQFEELIG